MNEQRTRTLAELANLVNGTLTDTTVIEISGTAPLDEVDSGQLTFIDQAEAPRPLPRPGRRPCWFPWASPAEPSQPLKSRMSTMPLLGSCRSFVPTGSELQSAFRLLLP